MNFIRNETAEKLRGGYYTPPDLAGFLARWIATAEPKTVLEPGCGDGIFFDAISKTGVNGVRVTAFELEPSEAGKAKERARRLAIDAEVFNRDFLGWSLGELHKGGARFDAVMGNPPFVRYQYLPAKFQREAEKVFAHLGCRFTKHTNAWVPFVLASMVLLRPGGRLAMVVPAEIINVLHAQSLRTFLGENCRRVVIVDPEEIWFEDTLQGAVLLLAEKKNSPGEHSEGLGLLPVRGRDFVHRDPCEVFAQPTAMNGRTVQGKWTGAFLGPSAHLLLEEVASYSSVHRFQEIAEVDVGIVTGANKFFLVDDKTVEAFGLDKWAHPMFGRSEHCPGIIYDAQQHRMNARAGLPSNFLWFPDGAVERHPKAAAYIREGERSQLHTRYKCRIREPWYSVPSVYSSEIGMLKRAHDAPRLILNKLGAYTTDTAYRIRSQRVPAKTLVAAFVNPLTALSAEMEGRTYGGGVLELVPSEIERLLIPVPSGQVVDLHDLDEAVRSLPMEKVLATHGRRTLTSIGLSGSQCDTLVAAWMQLRNRRRRITSAETESV